ncbi:MAG TPA: cob(I)yrinic acid a,c-diamide adenosyltransferase [Peptococcaceae bacterium]|nr:MAG: Cob(I)yrinic acid a,c-diamide adenosyltransferase [Clostridia bacterium 41_269]HBT20498.1 cob(I)yrinic acid a,c-diamide adenosyltransferase [Peptococcaceae bacterium]
MVLNRKNKLGLVQVYTGNGKGKTTAAFGQALRAYGHGFKIGIFLFLKDCSSGEVKTVKELLPDIDVKCFGSAVNWERGFTAEDKKLVSEGFKIAKSVIRKGQLDMLILDEICVAVELGFIEENELISIIKEKPSHMEIIITGRNAPKALIESAHLVTEMREVKHPFKCLGLKARKGIEY